MNELILKIVYQSKNTKYLIIPALKLFYNVYSLILFLSAECSAEKQTDRQTN